jgi:hypothetical protein
VLSDAVNTPGLGTSAGIENLRDLLNRGLGDVGTCKIVDVEPKNPKAGLDSTIYVDASIPFANSSTNGTASMTLLGSTLSAPVTRFGFGEPAVFGSIVVPANVSSNAAAQVGQVVVTASSVIGPQVGGVCPEGSGPSPGGQCIISCTTAPVSVTWESPPVPEIKLFLVAPSTINAANPTPIGLTWIVKNAKSVTIDQGVGEVDSKAGVVFELPPDKDTTYTLTAVGARPQDTKTATQKVTVTKPLTVNINSPGSGLVTASSGTVTGNVFPAPSAPGLFSATISVNGVPKLSVPVDGAGNFSGAVALAKTTNPSLLNLVNPDLGVGGCGDRSTSVSVQNSNALSDVENVIGVTVTDGSQQASSSVTVVHAVRLFDFVVDWLSCPPINKNEERNIILGPNEATSVGTVDCGCKNAPEGCHGPCTVQASVATSLGILFDNATWTFNVAGPCP